MMNAFDTREFRHAGARRLRTIMKHSEWRDTKLQCPTSQDLQGLEQFLRDELIKHDTKYPVSEQNKNTRAEKKMLKKIDAQRVDHAQLDSMHSMSGISPQDLSGLDGCLSEELTKYDAKCPPTTEDVEDGTETS